MAININHWLKVLSRWFKYYIHVFGKKCILITIWIFKYCFYFPSNFIIVPYLTLWMLDFSIPSRCQTAWIQSRLDILSDLILVQFVIPGQSRKDIVLALSVRPFGPSTLSSSGTISQYLLVRFDSFLVPMISTMDSRYPISLVKIDPLKTKITVQ